MEALTELREELPHLPEDPYLVLPSGDATSRDVYSGQLLSPDEVVPALLPGFEGLDAAGLYAGGTSIRAYADSAGQRHWFETETFTLDYSLFTEAGQAVKGTYAGREWDAATYSDKLATVQAPASPDGATPQSPGTGPVPHFSRALCCGGSGFHAVLGGH